MIDVHACSHILWCRPRDLGMLACATIAAVALFIKISASLLASEPCAKCERRSGWSGSAAATLLAGRSLSSGGQRQGPFGSLRAVRLPKVVLIGGQQLVAPGIRGLPAAACEAAVKATVSGGGVF